MNLNEVRESESVVDRLNAKVDCFNAKLRETCGLLERIVKLSAELPNEDDCQMLSSEIGSAAASLEQFSETWNSDRIPTIEELQE